MSRRRKMTAKESVVAECKFCKKIGCFSGTVYGTDGTGAEVSEPCPHDCHPKVKS